MFTMITGCAERAMVLMFRRINAAKKCDNVAVATVDGVCQGSSAISATQWVSFRNGDRELLAKGVFAWSLPPSLPFSQQGICTLRCDLHRNICEEL